MTLRAYLDFAKCSQAAFASRLKVSPSEVSLWIAGKRHPNATNVMRIRALTGGKVELLHLLPPRN
jgi:DNA-binding transcriptional regulator YdaS (Cro superfamily)